MKNFRSTFFQSYAPLDEGFIAAALSAEPAPKTYTPGTDVLDGKQLKIVLDDGPVLLYAFAEDRLTLKEGDAEEISAPYAAKALDDVVLFSHLIPGTVRGYGVVVDLAAGLATAFELWFGGYAPEPREVWRDFKFGYVDTGAPAPPTRHALTSRLFGKVTYWKDDCGTESLYFFPSMIWSSWVELSDPLGGITLTAPTDYIKIGDYKYIVSRGEQTFGGALRIEVIDLFTMRHVGVRLGFCKSDKLRYDLFEGKGRVTGAATNLALIEDGGENIHYDPERKAMLGIGEVKGMRPFYRPLTLHDDWSEDDVKAILDKGLHVFVSDEASVMKSQNAMPVSDFLVGKTIRLAYDGDASDWEYEFLDEGRLRYRVDGGAWAEEIYRAYELAKDVLFFSHVCTGSEPMRGPTHAVDFSSGLATCIDARLGNGRRPWEVDSEVAFGILECEGGPVAPAVERHSFTRDLLGKSFAWYWGPHMKSMHVYSTPESYSWTVSIGMEGGTDELGLNQFGWMWSSACHYIKIREDAYLMCWVEENHEGIQCVIGINPLVMQQVGFHFGISVGSGEPLFTCHSMGAFGRQLHGFELEPYFGTSLGKGL
jgi:hypothetical protein